MTILFCSDSLDPSPWRAALADMLPDIRFADWGSDESDDAEFALVWKFPLSRLNSHTNLSAIFSLGAGVDWLVNEVNRPENVPIVRLVDPALTRDMTLFVVNRVVHFHRRLENYVDQQRHRKWAELDNPAPPDCRVAILGLGELGADAARCLAQHGFKVAGWSRTAKKIDGVECVAGKDAFVPLLERTDIVVCMLPLTPETENILDKRAFEALPRGAYVINVARGAHVVDEDLIDALNTGHLAGAALDVFRTEPLPDNSPFWNHPKIIATPHIASITSVLSAAGVIAKNIRRIQNGEPPLNLVEPARGY